ncbi:MAG: hypothetical protein C0483_21370 [Pirellula sp.]|nr:hypothetical protein [Pirellula sp.]
MRFFKRRTIGLVLIVGSASFVLITRLLGISMVMDGQTTSVAPHLHVHEVTVNVPIVFPVVVGIAVGIVLWVYQPRNDG